MSRHATFENFGMAFLTLFQVSTGDNWNGIMKVHKKQKSCSTHTHTQQRFTQSGRRLAYPELPDE